MKPITTYMDVTRTVQIPAVVGAVSARTVVTVVIVDQEGEPLTPSAARMDGSSFSARDGIGPRVGRTTDGVRGRPDGVRANRRGGCGLSGGVRRLGLRLISAPYVNVRGLLAEAIHPRCLTRAGLPLTRVTRVPPEMNP